MYVAEADVAIAVTTFLNKACKDAPSAFFDLGSVWKESAVIGTNAVGIPIHNNIFGKRMISIYATLIEKGLKTIDEIPLVIREQVKLYLQRD